MVVYHRGLLLAERAHAVAAAVAVHVTDDVVAIAVALILGAGLGGLDKVGHACTQATVIRII